MENYILKMKQPTNKIIDFDEWIDLNLDILNEIIYSITNTLYQDSKNYNFIIDEVKLSNDLLYYIYNTSYSRFKNELNFIKD